MSRISRILALIILPVVTLAAGWQLGKTYEAQRMDRELKQLELLYSGGSGSGAVLTNPEKQVDLSMMWGVWRLLLTRYIHPEELQTQKLVEGAVRGMVNAVGDPYTLFMTPKENTDFRDSLNGRLQGIGAELALRNNAVIIMGTIKGSPAEKSGLLSQDILISVDGKTLENLTLNEVVSLVRGKKGTNVTLAVMRAKETTPRTFTITRDDIQVPSTEYEEKTVGADKVGLLTIHEFGGDTIREVQEIIAGLKPEALKGLVVDLRYNGGGYLDGAISLTSMFIKQGTVVTVAGRGTEKQVYEVTRNPILPDLPVVVLINQGTASASEIFAGALKDHNRAKVIGMQSYGKGTVQEVIDLPGGSSLRVTIARWLTPKGTDLGKVGVTPDIIVDLTQEDVTAEKDPQLQAALEVITTGKVQTVKTGTGATR